MTTIDIACATDAEYVPHSAAMVHSALQVHGGDLRVHFLPGPDVTAKQRRLLREMVETRGGSISFLEVRPEQVEGLPSWTYISNTMWYRIFLPELLPEVGRVLYLDVDTIIMDSLEPLWGIDLSGSLVGAVTNVFPRLVPDRAEPFEIERSDPPYFNSGVLLMNLDQMRAAGATDELVAYGSQQRDKKGWPDQDALNHVLGGRRHALHPRWNFMNSFKTYSWSVEVFGADVLAEARRDPAIRHFEGPSINKPWHLLCESEMRDVYREHRRQTPWPRYLPAGLTPANVLRRLSRRQTLKAA
jgi:lipopolysaccharide biosynthesis glycosyltransferase